MSTETGITLRALAPSGTRMFQFDDRFHEATPASFELGRSFMVPEYQNSFHGLPHPGHERRPHCRSRYAPELLQQNGVYAHLYNTQSSQHSDTLEDST